MTIGMGSVDRYLTEAEVREVVEQIHPGAILVLHESLEGPPVARLADEILPRLQEAGYEFVLVNDMWQTVRPGEEP